MAKATKNEAVVQVVEEESVDLHLSMDEANMLCTLLGSLHFQSDTSDLYTALNEVPGVMTFPRKYEFFSGSPNESDEMISPPLFRKVDRYGRPDSA